jgi:hypothetical protein
MIKTGTLLSGPSGQTLLILPEKAYFLLIFENIHLFHAKT